MGLLLFKNTVVEYAFNPHLGITFRQDLPNIARNARYLLKTRGPSILVFNLCEPPSFSIGDLRTPLVWRGSPRFHHQFGYAAIVEARAKMGREDRASELATSEVGLR